MGRHGHLAKLALMTGALGLGLGLPACGQGHADEVAARPPPAPATASPQPGPIPAPAETCVGVADRGIWSELAPQVQLELPPGLTADRVSAVLDRPHALLLVQVDGWPTKPYPLVGDAVLVVGPHQLMLRAGDRAELAPLLRPAAIEVGSAGDDRDHDGIPDPLDVLLGARKTLVNAAAYQGGYERLSYPGGDVARDHGVCTDVVVRALRNAGLDLQVEVHQDIARAPRAYPMVRGGGDANIDHRRVKTIAPYFKRHFVAHTVAFDDPRDPWRPGDVVLLDTFPSRSGPDHIGIVSDRRGASGLPLVINNWTDGTVTAEMDLLAWVPVTHRFRIPPASRR